MKHYGDLRIKRLVGSKAFAGLGVAALMAFSVTAARAAGDVGCGTACVGGTGTSSAAAAVCSNNLLSNGSFEGGLSGWTRESGAAGVAQSYARDGAYTAYVVKSTSSGPEGRLVQSVAIQSNRAVTFTLYSGTHDSSNSAGQTIELHFYNNGGNEVGSPIVHEANHHVDSDGLVAGPFTFNTVSPASAASAKVIIRDTSSQRYYIKADGLCLTDGPLPATPTPTATRTPTGTPPATPTATRTPGSTATPVATATPGGVGSIGNWVFYDTNADGQQNAGDWGLDGVTVKLFNATTNAQVGSDRVTSGGGYYQFSSVPAGSYYLQFITPWSPADDWFTDANVGPDATDSDANVVNGTTQVFTLGAGETNNTLDAGIIKLSSIGDFVWLDENENGQQDGEPGLPGVGVTLYDANGVAIRSTSTNAAGYYEFRSLRPGTYSLGFTKPAGYDFTVANSGSDALDSDADPGTGRTALTQLKIDQHDTTWDAGFKRAPTPTPTNTPGGPTPTNTPTPTSTPGGPTPTPTATATQPPPSATSTPVATATPTQPPPTATPTLPPTETPTRAPSSTPPPTSTPASTPTPPSTSTPFVTPTPPVVIETPVAVCPSDSGVPELTVGTDDNGHADIQAQFGTSGAPWYCRVKPQHGHDAPPNGIVRGSYPRVLVSYPITMAYVNGQPGAPSGAPPIINSSNGSSVSSVEGPSVHIKPNGDPASEGLYKDATLHIRSRHLQSGTLWIDEIAPGPQWRFADRAWNANSGQTQTAISVTYRYETSSWGLPLKGRSFDKDTGQPGAQNLPAYLVEVRVPVGWEIKWTYRTTRYVSEWVDGIEHHILKWTDVIETPWKALDLRDYGQPRSYTMQKRSQSGGLRTEGLGASVYWDAGDEIRVPVVEVQSVIRDNCSFDGSCASPVAEDDTLTTIYRADLPLP